MDFKLYIAMILMIINMVLLLKHSLIGEIISYKEGYDSYYKAKYSYVDLLVSVSVLIIGSAVSAIVLTFYMCVLLVEHTLAAIFITLIVGIPLIYRYRDEIKEKTKWIH